MFYNKKKLFSKILNIPYFSFYVCIKLKNMVKIRILNYLKKIKTKTQYNNPLTKEAI